jgi:hypothetical protein
MSVSAEVILKSESNAMIAKITGSEIAVNESAVTSDGIRDPWEGDSSRRDPGEPIIYGSAAQ